MAVLAGMDDTADDAEDEPASAAGADEVGIAMLVMGVELGCFVLGVALELHAVSTPARSSAEAMVIERFMVFLCRSMTGSSSQDESPVQQPSTSDATS
jgi:hypothetical protein